MDGTGAWGVVVVAPYYTGEDGFFSSGGWLMITTLHFVCFRTTFLMREKSPARSILDCIYGLKCCSVRAMV